MTPIPKPSSGQLAKGAIFIVLAFLANTVQSVLGKQIGTQLSVELFTWATFLSALIFVTPIMVIRKFQDLHTSVAPYHLLRGATGIAGFFLFITSAQLTSLVDANVLLNTTPIFIPILALLVLKQNIQKSLWLAIGLGFAGMVIIVKPDSSLFTNPGNIIALAAGLMTAIEFLTVKKLDNSESAITQIFYFLLFGSVCSTILSIGKFKAIAGHDLHMVIATGACLVLFQFLIIKAYQYAKPHEIGAFQYSSIIFSAVFGIFIFNEPIGMGTYVGSAFICIGGAMSIGARKDDPGGNNKLKTD
ncbi:DMT family transporter [Cyanobium sp. HWJ4-Hawea]|uniref:DMT family transporter n=1 Tax=Cyanobium sp. HWJ4-Hawea TaxID=2823713 RepID=UPI0020CF0207|nr:DMT family transporter [Cyanobium sp. HWJ4-Hawea]MCP9810111.1 DMT family transporter [Cyanobium sp. HWJ4-Hawea]